MKMMVGAYREVAITSRNHQISLRQAAYTLAVQHVVEAMKVRGWV